MASRIFTRQLILIIFIVLLSVFSGCTTEEEGSSDDYYVRFKLDGTDYEFTSGISRDEIGNTYSGDACGFRTKDEGIYSGIIIMAGPSPIDLNDAETYSTSISLAIDNTAETIIAAEPTNIRINDTLVWECDIDAVYTVTEIGNFGGVISGTFSGFDAVNSTTVTDGEFYVIRLQDNVYTF